jgi:hypothetical protein
VWLLHDRQDLPWRKTDEPVSAPISAKGAALCFSVGAPSIRPIQRNRRSSRLPPILTESAVDPFAYGYPLT